MIHVRPVILIGTVAATLVLAGCAPAASGGPSAGATPSSVPATAPASSSPGTSGLNLVDVCTTVSASSMASLMDRPYTEADNDSTTTTSSTCDYEGSGGLTSMLDLNLSMQLGASKSDLDKVLANLADSGETAAPVNGLGDYAASIKDVVAALYGTTLIVATDSGEPTAGADLSTAQLTGAIKALVKAAS